MLQAAAQAAEVSEVDQTFPGSAKGLAALPPLITRGPAPTAAPGQPQAVSAMWTGYESGTQRVSERLSTGRISSVCGAQGSNKVGFWALNASYCHILKFSDLKQSK